MIQVSNFSYFFKNINIYIKKKLNWQKYSVEQQLVTIY